MSGASSRPRRHAAWRGLTLLLLAGQAPGACPQAVIAQFLAADLVDGNDLVPGDGVCRNARGGCNLRAAIEEANTQDPLALPTCIELIPGVHNLSLAGRNEDAGRIGDLDVHANLVVVGASTPEATVIAGGGVDRVLQLHGTPEHNPHLELHRLTLAGGDANDSLGGGAILSAAVLGLFDVVVRDNRANMRGGGIAIDASAQPSIENTLRLSGVHLHDNEADQGSAIAIRGTVGASYIAQWHDTAFTRNRGDNAAVLFEGVGSLHVSRCAFGDNFASGGVAALDVNGAFVQMDACTVSGHRAGASAMRFTDAQVRLHHLTVVDNLMDGLQVFGPDVVLRHSILALNAGIDLALPNPAQAESRFNLVGSLAPGLVPLPTWLVGLDPQLAPPESASPLAGREPLAGSPALDAVRTLPGSAPPSCAGVDQHGTSRPQIFASGLSGNDGCDIGAVERRQTLMGDGFENGGDTFGTSISVPGPS